MRDGFSPDALEARCGRRTVPVLGRPAIAVFGSEGARMLYERPAIKRQHAVRLDGPHHRRRKDMFMQIMEPERLKELGDHLRHGEEARPDVVELTAR